jgi:SAM-dependent methyltransferase
MSESGQPVTRADLDAHIFRKSVPMQVTLQEILKVAGELKDKRCLAIGSTNAMLSYQLRRGGGVWQELVFDAAMAVTIRELVGEDVNISDDDSLPFSDKCFDLVVILDGLSDRASDAGFVELCHKSLKPEGNLIVCVPREKKMTLMGPLRSLLGLSTGRYTEGHLFAILKSGFDVMGMRSYSRFFVEFVDAWVLSMARRRRDREPAEQFRVYAIAYVFYWLAYQLDLLVFMARGHRLIACAKRRGWRSRDAPILVDGRSISEAVLSSLAR